MADLEKPALSLALLMTVARDATMQNVGVPVAKLKVVQQITGDPGALAKLKALSGKETFGQLDKDNKNKDVEALADIIAPDLAGFAIAGKGELAGLGTDAYQKVADTLYDTLKKHVAEVNADGRNFSDDGLKAFADNIAKKSTAELVSNHDLKPPSKFLQQSALAEQKAVTELLQNNVKPLVMAKIRNTAAESILAIYNGGGIAGHHVNTEEVAEAADWINANSDKKGQPKYNNCMYVLYHRAVELEHAPNEPQLDKIGDCAVDGVKDALLNPANNNNMAQAIQDSCLWALKSQDDIIDGLGKQVSDMNEYYFGHNKDLFADISKRLSDTIRYDAEIQAKLVLARTALQENQRIISNPAQDAPAPPLAIQMAAGITGGTPPQSMPTRADNTTIARSNTSTNLPGH